jgi:transposase
VDSDKYSTQVARLGVVETGRRRRWTDDEKLRIVLEGMQTPRAISSTARRYGISRSPEGASGQRSRFVPAMVVADPMPSAAPTSGHLVIEIVKDRRVIVDSAALARVLAILERR